MSRNIGIGLLDSDDLHRALIPAAPDHSKQPADRQRIVF